MITEDTIERITGKPADDNARSIIGALNEYGPLYGLDRPHRLAAFLGQILHESMGFRYDREIWGPTAAQKRYEGRADLGNIYPGDGAKFRGFTPMQITGRNNTANFFSWCVHNFPNLEVPNFVETPELMNTDPWEGLGPIWYWETGNPTGKSLNGYADRNDYENLTRRINGGLNGYADRCEWYAYSALGLLGMPRDIEYFQTLAGLDMDGIAGPNTRAALHSRLVGFTDNIPLTMHERVRATQVTLRKLGLYVGKIDGIMGPKTKEGVAELNAANVTVNELIGA